MHLLLKIICTAIYLVMFELLVRKLDSALFQAISDVFQQIRERNWVTGIGITSL
jgi:hypothetical protein